MSRRRLVPLSVAAVAVALCAGCGRSGGGAAEAGPPSTAASTAPDQAEQIAGRYGHYDVVAYESADMKTLITSYGFTDLSVDDEGGLVAHESFCHAEHRSDQPITTTISDAATMAITPESTPVTLTEEDGRARIQRPETPTGIGIHLEDPAHDELPTDPADPRVADDDGDGNPGITVHIKVSEDLQGDLYIARREIFAYDLLQQDDGSFEGSVSDHSEQLIVGASNDLFITREPWVQVEDPSKSPMVLVPVDDDWDCDRLMAEADAIFPPVATVDW